MWCYSYEIKSLWFLRDAQIGCHGFWPFELCIFESNSMQRLVLMRLGLISVTLRIHESEALSFYVTMILMPRFYDYVASGSIGGSVTLRP